ncbi:protein-disulfide reductase DsbD [Hansschlegelia zhihuaiae]|nr:protein-disulfide reductase DsbD [Hansschlegelia zhihuaiae]
MALSIFTSTSVQGAPPAPSPAEEAISLTASRTSDGTIELSWALAPGVYLYRDKIAAASGGRPVPVDTPLGKSKDDPTFGVVEIYDASFSGLIKARSVDASLPLEVTYQGCAEQGICYPPVTQQIDLAGIEQLGARTVVTSRPAQAAADLREVAEAKPSPPTATPSSTLSIAPNLAGDLTVVLATFFGLGLLLALTPCVYPMIPILVGVLARSGEALSPRRGLALSLSYVAAMAAAYGALGVAAALTGQNLQTALQTPAALTVASLVFVGLALSMFDIFQLQAPAAIASRIAPLTSWARGSVLGAASLGFVSALMVGPCVTPPLAAALVYVAQTGDVVRGSSALFALGLGMGAPLVAVGVFGAKILPKSGRWLTGVKHGFGIVFLGVAIALIGRVAPPAATLALWALLAIGLGVFLGAFDAVRRDAAGRRLSKAAGVAAVVYGATLVVGAASGADDALRPLSRLAVAQAQAEARSTSVTVDNADGLAARLTDARSSGRPSLVLFTADWCVTCAENEAAMKASDAVQATLQDFAVIKVDVTDNDSDAKAIMADHKVFGPPTALFYDRKGTELSDLRSIGTIDVEIFHESLRRTSGG